VTTTAIDRATALWNEGYQWEDLVAALRAAGFTKIDCIRVAIDLLRLPLSEAKRLIHLSPAWSDVRTRDDAFHALAAAAVAGAIDDADASAEAAETGLNHEELAQRLVAVVTALRASDLDTARTIVAELLDDQEPAQVVILSGVLTAALAEMAEIGQENLIQALGILVATDVEASTADAAEALARAEKALSAQ
jgi:hypothetical protein